MNPETYLAGVAARLAGQGFAPAPPPADLAARLPVTVMREEEWGRLLLAVTALDLADPAVRERLAAAAGAWVRNLQAAGGPASRPVHLVLVFPFTHRVPEEVDTGCRALAQAGPDRRWSVIPWTADLEVELVSQHSGFPRLDPHLARALTEVPRGTAEEVWRKATGPHVGRSWIPRVDLGYVPATRIILAFTVAIFGLQLVLPWLGGMGGLAENLNASLANNGYRVLVQGQHWRLLTHIFLHGNVLHILFNMWALWQVGRYVELLFGSLRMTFVYFVSGVAGGLASTVLRPGFVTSVGASGAILGLMGALVYFALTAHGRSINWQALLLPVGINLVYGFFVGGIDNYAHLGGFAGGVLAAFLAGVAGQQRQPWRIAAMGAVSLGVVIILTGWFALPHLPL